MASNQPVEPTGTRLQAGAARRAGSGQRLNGGVGQHSRKALLAAVLLLLHLACAEVQRDPQASVGLELSVVPHPVVAARENEFEVALVNTGSAPLSVCVRALPTVSLQVGNDRRHLRLGGLASDGGCAETLMLRPAETRRYAERLWVSADMPSGAGVLSGALVVRVGTKSADLVVSTERAATVVGRP